MERNKRKQHLIRIGSLLALWIAGLIFFKEPEVAPLPKPLPTEEEVPDQQDFTPQQSLVHASSLKVRQSDTLVLNMEEQPISIYFNGERFDAFQTGQNWLSVIGIGPQAKTGTYNLKASFINGESQELQIEVRKRSYPITRLEITPELTKQGYTPKTISENIDQRENQLIQQAMDAYHPKPYFSSPFQNPLSFMVDVGAYGNVRKSGTIELQHLGVDLDAKEGTPVRAVNDGTVAFQRKLTNYGNMLIVNHGLGIYSLYLHLDSFLVQEGQKVNKGQVIATSGNTGYSISPHLHFSIKVKGVSVDPVQFIKTFNEEIRK